MTTNTLKPQATHETAPALVIRTGWADCLAHFQPAVYQLVLHRPGGEEKVDLGFSGSRLLERLLRCPGDVVARDELLAHAWSDRVVGQGSLNQQIYTLRQVLGDEKNREIIQTLPRRGYLFNPRFLAPLPVAADESASDDAQTPHATSPLSPRRGRVWMISRFYSTAC
jgi:cholera toxin transcriptional activator